GGKGGGRARARNRRARRTAVDRDRPVSGLVSQACGLRIAPSRAKAQWRRATLVSPTVAGAAPDSSWRMDRLPCFTRERRAPGHLKQARSLGAVAAPVQAALRRAA